MGTIGFIGGGNMAEALIKGILQAGICRGEGISVSDVRQDRLVFLEEEYRIHPVGGNAELAGRADVIVLSVKPQQMEAVLGEIAGHVRKGTLVISIAAGVRTEKILPKLPGAQVIRVMPNTPAMAGAGATGIYSANADETSLLKTRQIFSAVGTAVVLESEDLLDAVTAVSGSGPAYFFYLMENMVKAGLELGLPERTASELVLQTALGAAMLAKQAAQRGEGPEELRHKVTSPGGTTHAAVTVFEEKGTAITIQAALRAACARSRELSQ
jgi:pyrroline-5-carboxylate reductase